MSDDRYLQGGGESISKLRPVESGSIPVDGGSIFVVRVGDGPKIVFGLHGVAGSHMTMQQLAAGLDDSWTLVVPDLRGRGASNMLPPPYGLEAHASDCERILDHYKVEAAVVAGHSMGAVVSELLAVRRPGQIKGLILIDGGLPLPQTVKTNIDLEQAIEATVGPILQNLRRTYVTEEEYFEGWRNHPAFKSFWNEDLQARFRYDLSGKAPMIRSRMNADAFRQDMTDLLSDPEKLRSTLRAVRCPMHLYRATRGILDQPEPLIADSLAAVWTSELPLITDIVIEETNHVSITLLQRAVEKIDHRIMTMI